MSTFEDQWVADGLPWCDTCGKPCVFNEFRGILHATEDHRFGLPRHADEADHIPSMRDWSEQGMRDRSR